jgi:membrane protein
MHSRLHTAWIVLRRAVTAARENRLTTTAQALAYSLFLAIPAAALVVLGVFSVAASPSNIDSLVERARSIMPAESAALLQDSLDRSARSTGGSIAVTVAGLALAVWTTTSAATTLMEGLTRTFEQRDARSFVRKRLVALLVVVALVTCAALVVSLLVLGPHVERWLGSALGAENVTAWAWWTAQWPLLVAALSFAFAVVLYLGPDVELASWRLVLPGALVAVGVWLAASGGFAVYAAHFGSYNKSWGTLSAVVVTLVWLWLTSAALLFGAEVNAQVVKLRYGAPGSPAPTTPSPGRASGSGP